MRGEKRNDREINNHAWMITSVFSSPIPIAAKGGSKNGKSSESESGGGDTDGQTEVRDLSESRRELKKRTCYMAASMPVVLACLYITWLLYDAGIVYRELRIDVATARVTVETTCNSQALKSKYPEEVIATTISSNACQEARKLSDCDQVKEFDNRFRERRLDTGHWFSGSSIVLACVYWVVINIIYNPLGAVGGALLVYYLGRRYWNWAPGPCLRTLRETYRLQRETKNGLPFEAHRKSD